MLSQLHSLQSGRSIANARMRSRAPSRVPVQAYKAPSYAPGGTSLEGLKQHTHVLTDHVYPEQSKKKLQAGSVSSEVLSAVLNNPSVSGDLKTAVKNAFAIPAADVPEAYKKNMPDHSYHLDRALVNLASAISQGVEGKIVVEVDMRLCQDGLHLVERAHLLSDLLAEAGLSKRALLRLPATWSGIETTRQLESEGKHVIVNMIYSLAQARAAAEAGASVIKIPVGSVRDFYRQHPNMPKDPHGPREDAGFQSPVDPAVRLVESIYNYVKAHHPKTQIMVSDIRSKEDALALAGVDYMVLNSKVLGALAGEATDQGYNDGLSGEVAGLGQGVERRLSPETAKKAQHGRGLPKAPALTRADFEASLGTVGISLLAKNLSQASHYMRDLIPGAANFVVGSE